MTSNYTVKQQRELYHSQEGELYGSRMFYVFGIEHGYDYYLRNDGKKFTYMAASAIDPDGGTYFFTHQKAQDCLDRYNATKDDSHQDTQT